MPRQSEYTEEIGLLICERLVEGRSLRSICKEDDMPNASTVFKWLGEQPIFSEQYARARDAQADTLADENLDIADDGTNDWMERKQRDGTSELEYNGDHVQRSRLRIDTRKWYASKLAPKKYGDKVALVGGTPGEDAPVQFTSDLDRAKAVASLVAKVKAK